MKLFSDPNAFAIFLSKPFQSDVYVCALFEQNFEKNFETLAFKLHAICCGRWSDARF
jgi:hypothetical protein